MTISLCPNNKSEDVFYQPQLTRYHHAYRSPYKTQQLNLQSEQLRFDIHRLYWKFSDLNKFFEAAFQALYATTTNNVAIALGYNEAVNYGTVYDTNEDGVVDGTNPFTSGFTSTDRNAVTSLMSNIFDGTISLEQIAATIQRFRDRIFILEEGL